LGGDGFEVFDGGRGAARVCLRRGRRNLGEDRRVFYMLEVSVPCLCWEPVTHLLGFQDEWSDRKQEMVTFLQV